jgi:hypothetical protein
MADGPTTADGRESELYYSIKDRGGPLSSSYNLQLNAGRSSEYQYEGNDECTYTTNVDTATVGPAP